MRSPPAPRLALLLAFLTSAGINAAPPDPATEARIPAAEQEAGPGSVAIALPGERTDLRFLVRRQNRAAWLRLAGQARAIADSLSAWYGPCIAEQILIVDGVSVAGRDSSTPGFVLLSQPPVPFTRIQERQLCRLLARQWFPPAPDDSAAWLANGLAEHACERYLETAYGPTGLLDLPGPAGPLSGLGEAYLKRVAYYVAASNDLLSPLAAAASRTDGSFLEKEGRLAQAGLFINMLRRELGPDVFDEALRFYRDSGGATAASLSGFIRALSLASRRNLVSLFDRWLYTRGTCDYAIAGVRAGRDDVSVGLKQVGSIPMPVEIEFAFADGTAERLTWSPESATQSQLRNRIATVRLASSKPVRRVVLDPDRRLLEPDRWNNHWPRRVEVEPVFSLPSLEAYQLFYGPYAWYDNYHGIQLGAWVQGRQFVDAGPLRGRHMWTLSETYSTKIDDWHTGASYQTPLDFISNRLRVSFLGDYSLVAAGIRLSLLQELGRVFGKPNGLIDLGYRFFDLYSLINRDTLAWESARTAEIRVRVLHSYGAGDLLGGQSFYLGRGLTGLGGNYRYWKASLEENLSLRPLPGLGLHLRVFAGAISGDIPAQDQFYLSGGLVPNSAEPVSWGLKGMSSGQEHWHYDADVNCRGFAGEYRHGRFAWGANLYLAPLPFLLPFFDVGNVADSADEAGFLRPRMDAGVRLKLGPLYADFPLWRYSRAAGHEFAFRWMLGLKLGSGGT